MTRILISFPAASFAMMFIVDGLFFGLRESELAAKPGDSWWLEPNPNMKSV